MCSGLVTVLYIIECVARAVCRGWLSRPGRKRANLRATLCVVFPSNNSLFPDVVYSRESARLVLFARRNLSIVTTTQ